MQQREAGPVLLVEEDPSLAGVYESVLSKAGFDVETVADVAAARAALDGGSHPVVVLDLTSPNGSVLDMLRAVSASGKGAKIVAITADGSISLAVAAMRAGAFDFLVKPFDDKRLLAAVRAAADAVVGPVRAASGAPEAVDAPRIAAAGGFAGFIGSSDTMRDLFDTIRTVGRSSATVFLTGESGTGKELAAQAIHDHSARSDGPFVPINCGAIPSELLESEVFGHLRGAFTGAIADKKGAAAAADGGTLFLDEICEMHLALQTKLLRFLQTSSIQPVGATTAHPVDVRIVCATNRDPMADVRAGRFREDLYYRLHVVPIALPPLRARGNDVIEIADRLLAEFSREERRGFRGFDPAAEKILMEHRWPGNVRELQNVLRKVVVLHDGLVVTADMLPPELRRGGGGRAAQAGEPLQTPAAGSALSDDAVGRFVGMTLAEMETAFIAATIAECGGSIPKAARMLGVSPSTLYRKRGADRG